MHASKCACNMNCLGNALLVPCMDTQSKRCPHKAWTRQPKPAAGRSSRSAVSTHLVPETDDRHHQRLQECIAHNAAHEGVHEGLQQAAHEAAAAAAEPAAQVQLQDQCHQALVGGPAIQVLRLQGRQCPSGRDDLCHHTQHLCQS